MRLLHWVAVLFLSAGLAGCGGGGGGGNNTPPMMVPPPAANSPPTVTIMASGQVASGTPSAGLAGSVGGEINLSGMASTDPEGDAVSFQWTLTSKPAMSTLAQTSSTAMIAFTPDAFGTFTFTLRVTDAKGAFAERAVPITVNNTVPSQAIVVTPTFSAMPTVQPTQPIAVGGAVILDASGSRDPDGDPLIITSNLIERPAGSASVLSIDGRIARFTADTKGLYRVVVRAQDSAGAFAETTYVFDAQNTIPNAVVVASGTPRTPGQGSIRASVGFTVLLDGTGSFNPDGGTLTRNWAFVSKPPFSFAQLSTQTGLSTQFAPDVFGDYVVRLTVTNTTGLTDTFVTTVTVNNSQPIADITTSAGPTSAPSAPAVSVPLNTPVILRGGASSDPDGEALTYLWSVVSAPAGSTAIPATPTLVNTQFTPDLDGIYTVRLRVTDSNGVFSDRSLTINAGNVAPMAVLNRNRATVVAGDTVSVSAVLSFDEDQDPLTYSWVVDVAPPTSAARLVTATTPNFSFIADVPGLYLASVTVSDGRSSRIGQLAVRAFAATSDSVVLPFVPLETRYDKQLDKMILSSSNPDALKIVDPRSGLIRTVTLPFPVKTFSLSPDGLLASVLHDGRISLVDLDKAQLLRTAFTQGAHTDSFLQNDGIAYLIGETGGQFVRPQVRIIDARRGVILPDPPFFNGLFFGTQRGVFADRKNKVLSLSFGLSPQSLTMFTIDPVQHTVLQARDMWLSSGGSIGSELFLSEDQELVFSSSGSFFDPDTLEFIGRFGLSVAGQVISLTQSARNDEVLLLQSVFQSFDTQVFRNSYQRFFGPLQQLDGDIALPTIGGEQSFGLEIFHSANEDTVFLVQTGGVGAMAPGLRYHIVVR